MRIGDRYELERPLGEGGMAGVFLARDVETGDAVAVKQMHAELGKHEELRARFLREGRIVARLAHPYVVAIHDVVPVEETGIAMVMEFVEGCDLSAVIKRNPPLVMCPELAAQVLRPIAEALAYVHGEGIIHRDVKPANVLLGLDGSLKLTDFGIARGDDDDQGLTRTGDFLGTPAYIPPEQARGIRVTTAADQYALGVMLYQLTTGEKPFAARSTAEIVLAILRSDYPDPQTRCAAIDDRLAAVINRAMAHEPGARYADVDAFIAALDACIPPVGAERTAEAIAALVADPEAATAAFARRVADGLVSEGEVAYEMGDGEAATRKAKAALARDPAHAGGQALFEALGRPLPHPGLSIDPIQADAEDDDTVFDPRKPTTDEPGSESRPGNRHPPAGALLAAPEADLRALGTAETDPSVVALDGADERADPVPGDARAAAAAIGRASPDERTVLRPAGRPEGIAGWKVLAVVFAFTVLIGAGVAWVVHSQPPTAPPRTAPAEGP